MSDLGFTFSVSMIVFLLQSGLATAEASEVKFFIVSSTWSVAVARRLSNTL